MKRLLMIGYNFAPEPTGIGKYSGEMISWLARHGYDCTVITAYPYYPYWKVQEPYYKKRFWYKEEVQYFDGGGRIRVFRCPMYVPANPSGFKRILLDFSFILSALFKLMQLLPGKKFDFILSIVPSFLIGFPCILYKKLQGAKLFYHIHDMQIEAARDLKMIQSENLIKTLFRVEKQIFKQCDAITCVGEGMVRKTQDKINKKITLFPNWTDLKEFYPLEGTNELKKEFGFKPSDKILLYSGAIGEKQGLDVILHAAKALEAVKGLKFLICGSGPYKEKLQQMAEALSLKNVFFCPLQPKEKFNHFLNIADVHLVIQKASACDLVMPSKLTTILAVGGLAIVTANQGSGLHSTVNKHQMGILVEAENSSALVHGILKSISANNIHVKKNARAYAENYLAIDKIMGSFALKLESAVAVPVTRVESFKEEKNTSLSNTKKQVNLSRDVVFKQSRQVKPLLFKDRPFISLSKKKVEDPFQEDDNKESEKELKEQPKGKSDKNNFN